MKLYIHIYTIPNLHRLLVQFKNQNTFNTVPTLPPLPAPAAELNLGFRVSSQHRICFPYRSGKQQ